MLNDWSSAAAIGISVPWVGTRGYSEELEVGLQVHFPSAKSDLIAFVRTAFAILMGIHPDEDYKKFWAQNMNLQQYWAALMEHAENCNYDGLRDMVASL